MSGRKQWLTRWGGPVLVWGACALGLTANFADRRDPSRWLLAAWICITAVWVAIACMKDSVIASQRAIIRLYMTATDLMLQKRKAGLS